MRTTAAVGPDRLDGVDVLTLRAGDLRASFAPRLGMAGVSLLHRGDELLDRRAGLGAYARTGAVMGIPLLHPWANRLDAHEYELDGRHVRLPAGSPLVHCEEHGLPIHGVLNASPYWSLAPSLDAPRLHAQLEFGAHPDLLAAFPFPHELAIDVVLDPTGIELATTVTATGLEAVRLSFGFHPYLRLPGSDRAGWRVALPVRRHLALDERGIPTGARHPAPAATFALGDRAFDDGFDQLLDGARFSVKDDRREVALTLLSGYPAAQIYSPSGAQFICFEPMTAPTNALRTGDGLRRVPPGESFTARFRIDVLALADATTIRTARTSERDALEQLQRRSSMHDPMYRMQLAAHPDAIELPVEQITAGHVRVARAERIARERDATRIDVIANPQSVAFYEAVGFEPAGDAQTRFGPAPRMSLPITS